MLHSIGNINWFGTAAAATRIPVRTKTLAVEKPRGPSPTADLERPLFIYNRKAQLSLMDMKAKGFIKNANF